MHDLEVLETATQRLKNRGWSVEVLEPDQPDDFTH